MKDKNIKKILESGIEKMPNKDFNKETMNLYKEILTTKKIRESKSENLALGLIISGMFLVSILFFTNFEINIPDTSTSKVSESIILCTIFLFVFSIMILASDLIERKRS